MASTTKSDWRASAQEAAAGVGEMAEKTAHQVSEKARDAGLAVADKAKDAAQAVADKAKEAGAAAMKGAGQAASFVGKKAEDATAAVGSGIESLGCTLRDRGPREGVMGDYTSEVAKSLESTGQYIKEHGLSGMGEDLTNLIRRNPVPALLVGVAAGYLIARAFRR
jgi:hypothetical protein